MLLVQIALIALLGRPT